VSQRGIADVLGCSRNTVASVFAAATAAGVGFGEVVDLAADEVRHQLARPTGTTQPKTHVARPAPEQRPTNQRNSGSPNSGTAAFTERDIHLHVHEDEDGCDRLDLQAANYGWLPRQDVGVRRNPVKKQQPCKRRGRRRPPSRRSVVRIKAHKALKRQSRSARTFPVGQPTALPAQQAA
jgi:hypothetical protein